MRTRFAGLTLALMAAIAVGAIPIERAWCAEEMTLEAKVEALSKEVASLKETVTSLRGDLESAKLTLTAALSVVQLLKDNLGSASERSGSLGAETQKLMLQVEKNRDNIVLMRDLILASWYMDYYAMQRAKGNVEAEQKYNQYDEQSKDKFKNLEKNFQDRPSLAGAQ